MFLSVPTRDVSHVSPTEGNEAIVFAVSAVERSEESAPLWGHVEAIGIVERVTRLVGQIHHDLAFILEFLHLALEARELGIGQIKWNADHGLARFEVYRSK